MIRSRICQTGRSECARIGLVACTLCGAALVLDIGIDFDVLERHQQWHAGVSR